MTLVTSIPWLKRAQAEQYAIGAFHANTMEQMQAIAQAAQAEQGPAVIQVSQNALAYMGSGNRLAGMRVAAAIGRVVAESVSVPLVLHLDNGNETEVLQALVLGFSSVMFDGSDLPFEENVAHARKLCEAAHQMGVCFEAELGEAPHSNVPGMQIGEPTDPVWVAEFVERTGIDALAVSVGSVHALKQKPLTLDLDRLAAIRSVAGIPLVLHGSSGVLDESVCDGIRYGLCKINVATQLNGAFTAAVRNYLNANLDEVDPRKYLALAREQMMEQVRERMRLYGASGKAPDPLAAF